MKTLDRTRNFGTVSPGAENGAMYHQDGIYFDAHGDEILTLEQREAALAAEKSKKGPPKTPKAAESATAEEATSTAATETGTDSLL